MSAPGPQRRAPRGAVGGRRCAGCGVVLAADNTARLCSKCHREKRDEIRTPPTLRDEFFETDEFRAAFTSQHIGRVFKAYRNHPHYQRIFGKALNQELLGRWLGLNQAQVSKIENGKPEYNHRILCHYAKTLHLPQHLLWFDIPGQSRLASPQATLTMRMAAPEGQEADRLTAEILESNTTDEAIHQLADVAESLAESHTQAPARRILTQVFQLHGQAQTLLGGKQRLSQKRELFRIESDLLAHACLLLDDLKQNEIAQRYGSIALSFAKEAGAGQATARTALAKTLRWAERLIESADMAKFGYECSPPAPIRIQLASQEANAAALMGNISRAQEALRRAELAAETVEPDSGTSAWSFPVGRQAIFALSVALQAGDPEAALRAVAKADASWNSGAPFVTANWAQIRAGAGIAHLLKGSLEAAIDEVKPVLTLAPELRISTVTAYMDRLDRQLSEPRFSGDNDVAEFRQGIRDFNSEALLEAG
jgi:hypothetical protein